jgi:hypothetical protein
VFALADNPVLLVVAFGIPLFVAAVVLFALYWVVRLAVRHGARDTVRSTPGASALPGPPTT